MTLNDRTRKRLRLVLSVVVVGAVLATFSEVREGVCKAVAVVIGGRSNRTNVAPVRDSGKPYARPSMIFFDGHSLGMAQPRNGKAACDAALMAS